jgi:hypothetical protein
MASDIQYQSISNKQWTKKILLDRRFTPKQRENLIKILDRLASTAVGREFINLQEGVVNLDATPGGELR